MEEARLYELFCCQNLFMPIATLALGIVLGIAGSALSAVGFGTKPTDMYDDANTAMRLFGLILVGVAVLPLVVSVCCWFFYYAWKRQSKNTGKDQPPEVQPLNTEEGGPVPVKHAPPTAAYAYPNPTSGYSRLAHAPQRRQQGAAAPSNYYPSGSSRDSADAKPSNSIPMTFAPQAESIGGANSGNSFDLASGRSMKGGSGGGEKTTRRSSGNQSSVNSSGDRSIVKGSRYGDVSGSDGWSTDRSRHTMSSTKQPIAMLPSPPTLDENDFGDQSWETSAEEIMFSSQATARKK